MRNWVFVKVVTDQDGLFGWGEATLEWHTRAVVGAVEDLAPAARRRRPDAHRAPLADDVPPALLARQRHRPRAPPSPASTSPCGTSSARCTACRATSSGAGRCAITSALYCHLGGGRDGGLLRDGRRRRQAVRRPRPAGRRRRVHRVQVRWPCRRRCRSKACKPDPRTPRSCVAAMREAVGDDDRHHGRLPRPPVARDGAAVRQGARAVRPVLLRGAVLAGERGRPRDDPARREHADRDRRAA